MVAPRPAVEKTPAQPAGLEIPQTTRDSHFPTAATTTTPFPVYVSDSNISIPPGGYDVTGLFHQVARGLILQIRRYTGDLARGDHVWQPRNVPAGSLSMWLWILSGAS